MPHPERVADGQRHIAHAQTVGAAEGDGRQVLQINLEYRQIRFRVAAHHAGQGFAAVTQGHHDLVGAGGHVVVGEDVALRAHDHAGAEAGFHAALLGAVVTEVAAKLRVFKQRMRRFVDDLGGVQVDHRRSGDDHGIGIGHRPLHHCVGLRRLLQVHIQCGQAHPLGITLDNQHRDQHASQQWPSKKTQCLEHQVSPDRLQGAGERP